MNFEELCIWVAIFDFITLFIIVFGILFVVKQFYFFDITGKCSLDQRMHNLSKNDCLKDLRIAETKMRDKIFTPWDWTLANIFIAWDFLIATWLNYKYFTGDYKK